jgi:alkylresorcinol/alkylpyrone synthase
VQRWLSRTNDPQVHRLLSVYNSSAVKRRASVVPIERVFPPATSRRRTTSTCEHARAHGRRSGPPALESARLSPTEIDAVVSVSCTGYMIPAVDAHVADVLGMGPRLVRLPITESGCAGGIVGLARARDFLAAHPDRAALVIAIELSSLTFQPWDRSPPTSSPPRSSATGAPRSCWWEDDHRARALRPACGSSIREPVLPRHVPPHGLPAPEQRAADRPRREPRPFVRRESGRGHRRVPLPRGLCARDVSRWVLHPGGRRIIEVMAESLKLPRTRWPPPKPSWPSTAT